jgi:aspartate aminotransferase
VKSLARRAERIAPSLTVTIDARAKELKAAGVDIVSLGAGEPDFDTPEPICSAAIASIRAGQTRYGAPEGMLSLRQAVAAKLKRQHGLHYGSDQVILTSGAKHAISETIAVLIEEGDELLLPTPCWVTYPELVRFYGGTPVLVPCNADRAFDIDLPAFAKAITPRTKALLLNTPCNPTGTVYSAETLRGLAELCVQHDLFVISDEIYEDLVYDGAQHHSIATFPGMQERTLLVSGVSKSHAMTGWRLGWIATGNAGVARALVKVQGQLTHHPSNPAQHGALAALQADGSIVEQMRLTFEQRRNLVVEGLRAIPGLTLATPAGAFYAFPDVSAYLGRRFGEQQIADTVELCAYLLEEQKLALVPGAAFGEENCIRLSYAAATETLQEALRRLRAGLEALK